MCAAFVSEAATAEFVWGCMGSPAWRGTADVARPPVSGGGSDSGGGGGGTITLLPASRSAGGVCIAHVVAGPVDSVRFALVRRNELAVVHLVEVRGVWGGVFGAPG
eukprot:366352-Chlamydomonas_euryale.AAC.3